MRNLIVLTLALMTASVSFSQKKEKQQLNLTNAVVIGQLDNPEDRYSLEINMTEILSTQGVKAIPSLNVMKVGGDPLVLATDSIKQLLKSKGIDTYLIVSVRGYDRKYKVSGSQDDLKTALSIGGLFDLYRQDIVTISFEFKFYREGQFVYGDIIKCGNISDRESVLKRFRKKVNKRVVKKWK